MGARGPLRRPDSIRGQRERCKEAPTVEQKGIAKPAWLADSHQDTWNRVLEGLQAAGVPLEAIDAEAVSFYVVCIDGARDAAAKDDLKLVARFSRDAIAWGNLIGATPAARARMGIKPAAPPVRYSGGVLNGQFRPGPTGDAELDAVLMRPRVRRA